MNSDKFDRVVLDLLYGELDELTTAAAKRHMDQSARAREIYAHLKVTRQLGVLPTHSPPADFEQALMQQVGRALAELPLHHRIGRIVSMLAGYAMRPQLIMGALLLLMIGSSLMFLRARPGQHSAVQVTERGAPEADVDLVLPVVPAHEVTAFAARGGFQNAGTAQADVPPGLDPAKAAPKEKPNAATGSADAGGEGLDPFDQALQVYRAGQYGEAQRRFERVSRSGGPRSAEAALYSAQATRNASGCAAAVSRFERVRLRFPGSGFSYEAAWRAAKCSYQLGDIEGARQSYESLLHVANYAERAQRALTALGASPASSVEEGPLPGSKPARPTAPRATEDDANPYAVQRRADVPMLAVPAVADPDPFTGPSAGDGLESP